MRYTDIFVCLSTRYLLSTCCVLGTVLWAGDVAGNKQDTPALRVVAFLCVSEGHNNIQTNIRWKWPAV